MAVSKFSQTDLPSAKTIVSTAASVAASAMVVRSIARDLIPYELQQYVDQSLRRFFRSFSSEIVLIIEEFEGLANNQIYKAAGTYLGTEISPLTKRFVVSMPDKESKISTSVAKNGQMLDKFRGVELKWRQVTMQAEIKRPGHSAYQGQSSSQSEVRYFELRFNKKHKNMVLESYFPFIIEESKKISEQRKTLKIHTLNSEHSRRYAGDHTWKSMKLDHPATFDTLAMDAELKKMIMDDLEMFVRRRDFYRKVGKAWKRGYLLYGPPGTGKSSLIAAMANYLNFDIYDLELTDLFGNSDLRRVMISTGNRSILVVEDIDCSLPLEDRQKADEQTVKKLLRQNPGTQATINIVRKDNPNQITLSGLLNFIDGLWSSCGDERIIVFTTNHKDRLDPALLRPGRMDVHIHMSYCTPCAFNTLASNYHGVISHSLFPEIYDLLEKTKVTPAEVGEQLLRNEDVDVALGGLIEFLQRKRKEAEEAERKNESDEESNDQEEKEGKD